MRVIGGDAGPALLTGLLDRAHNGVSHALVAPGEAGIGRSALLEHLGATATGFGIHRTAGVEAHLRNIFRKLDLTSRRQLRDTPPA